MEEMKTFECAICGKKYNDLESRVTCETKCLKEFKKAEALKKADEHNTKRKESADAIYKKLTEVDLMLKEHMKEYKSFSLYGKKYPYLEYIFNYSAWWM